MAQAAAMARAQVAGAASGAAVFQNFGTLGGQPVMDEKTRKTLMEVFVGNLPPTCSGQLLMEFLNAALLEVKLNQSPGSPIVDHRHTPGAKYAFMVFRTAEEATAALNINGIPYLGTMVSILERGRFAVPS
jgi:splicing factor U2AF subunit